MLLVFELWHRNFLEKKETSSLPCPQYTLYGKVTAPAGVGENLR
jgi:hypothetical protein